MKINHGVYWLAGGCVRWRIGSESGSEPTLYGYAEAIKSAKFALRIRGAETIEQI